MNSTKKPGKTNVVEFPVFPKDLPLAEVVTHDLPSSGLVSVDFYGDELLAFEADDGVRVVVRRVCEALGLHLNTQMEKLKKATWASCTVSRTTAADGKTYEMMTIPVRAIPMWLAGISEERVAHQVRPKLVRYQLEAADVLARHFMPKATPAPSTDLRSMLASREGMAMVLLETAQMLEEERTRRERLEGEVLLLAEQNETLGDRACAAESKLDEVAGAVVLHGRMEKGRELYGFREAAKIIGAGPKEFVEFLVDAKYCHRLGRRKRLSANMYFVKLKVPLFHVAFDEVVTDQGDTIHPARTWITEAGLDHLTGAYFAWARKREAELENDGTRPTGSEVA